MKKFSFNLQKALDIRVHREQECKIALGQAIGALSLLEHQVEALEQERTRIADHFSSGFEAADILTYDRYQQRLAYTKTRLLKEITGAEEKVEEARDELQDASCDRKVLDKVRETREIEYRKFQLDEDTKTLDDLFRPKLP
ncbi:hypothetical protein FACS1894172_02560 [Spirochaetia bacterium]|nr:hypothetical protein FACS1894164_10040 [Spirochaetia bacterium]GHU30080.1 hypothetical protein FACS1894172_02560 [Spirochaetia bacterium]